MHSILEKLIYVGRRKKNAIPVQLAYGWTAWNFSKFAGFLKYYVELTISCLVHLFIEYPIMNEKMLLLEGLFDKELLRS